MFVWSSVMDTVLNWTSGRNDNFRNNPGSAPEESRIYLRKSSNEPSVILCPRSTVIFSNKHGRYEACKLNSKKTLLRQTSGNKKSLCLIPFTRSFCLAPYGPLHINVYTDHRGEVYLANQRQRILNGWVIESVKYLKLKWSQTRAIVAQIAMAIFRLLSVKQLWTLLTLNGREAVKAGRLVQEHKDRSPSR